MSNHPKLIAVFGAAQSGKSTLAEALAENAWIKREKFAAVLYEVLSILIGTPAEELIEISGAEKETPRPELCGKSIRTFLQLLGTEFGRDMIGPDLWANAIIPKILRNAQEGLLTVIDDMRFANELRVVRGLDGLVVRVTRPGHQVTHTDHASEQDWQTFGHDFELISETVGQIRETGVQQVLAKFQTHFAR